MQQKDDDSKKASESERLPMPQLPEYPFGGKTKVVTAVGKKHALITVNVQNDFVSGAMAIADAAAVIPKLNALRTTMRFDLVVHVRIAHPAKHIAFHGTSVALHNQAVGQSIATPSGTPQTLWPAHCVTGTDGAAPHPALHVESSDKVVLIGQDAAVDCPSGFSVPELSAVLNAANISHVYVGGLGFGLWLGQTARDAMGEGFQTYLIADACRPTPPAPSASGSAGETAAAATSSTATVAAATAAAPKVWTASSGCEAMSVSLAAAHVAVMDSSVLLLSAPPHNRRTNAERYLAAHGIGALFEKLCTALVYHKPADPKQFLAAELGKLHAAGRSDRVALFTDDDLECMFFMLDPLSRGHLNVQQLKHALDSLCCKPGAVALPTGAAAETATFTLPEFKTKVRQALQHS